MLTPDYYESCVDDILKLYAQLEDDIISDIIRRMMKTGIVTESAKHQAEMLQNAGLLYDDILSEIAKRTDATSQHVKALFEDAGVRTVNFDNQIYRAVGRVPVDIRQSPAMRQTLEAGYRKTLGNMQNLTLTTANMGQTAYYNACNQAYMQIVSGAFSYQEAIKKAVQKTAQDGAFVLYPSGHKDRVDVAVRRSVLTGVGQTCREIGIMNATENDCDLMELSAHFGARPTHAEWQGQIVSLSGRKGYLSLDSIGYGTGDGFGGWNCRHDWFPYFEGYSRRNYTDSYLKSLNEKNIEYNGEKYSQYEISQIQRKYEREIRSAKREKVAFDTAVKESSDPELKSVMKSGSDYANQQIKDKQAKMRDFINQTGQSRDYFREQNYGKVIYPKNNRNSLTFGLNSGNINIKNQLYMPLNEENVDVFLSALVKCKGDKLSLEEKEILLIRNTAIKELKQTADKKTRIKYTAFWNVILANMQKPIRLSELPNNFCDNLIQSINSRHTSRQYDAVLRKFNAVVKNIPVLNQYTIGNSFYGSITYVTKSGKEVLVSGISINKAKLFKRDYITELHEIGHYIDNNMNYNRNAFSKLLSYDFENFETLNISVSNVNWEQKFKNAPELADILFGLTNGRYGLNLRPDGYWNDPEKLPAETFAHFFEATIRNDNAKINSYKEIFPESYRIFLKLFD